MSVKAIASVVIPLICYTPLRSQETQTAAPAQPTSSVYNRMRRLPSPRANQQNQQQTMQQFPNAGQFPPEQQGTPSPSMRSAMPVQRTAPQAPAVQQPVSAQPGQQQNPPQALAQQQQQNPSGLAQQPAKPPKISYENGELTISADNSSLSDIMSGIERTTGVRLEGTRPDAERVFGQFGPGSPRDVLNSLFSGSRYDFILTGALDDPGGVQTIILSPHGSSAPGGPVAANQPNPRPNENDDDEAPAAQSIGESPQPIIPNVPSEVAGPQQQGQQQQQVKTPEQLLQELQRLRQQQQQQQGQQPLPPQNVPR